MERLRITELLADHAARKGGMPETRQELAHMVMGEDIGRPLNGKQKPLSVARMRNVIGDWDQGKSLTALKPRHVLRLARIFRVSKVEDIFEE
jgi:hypothetical protein